MIRLPAKTAFLAAPLILALAACGSGEEEAAGPAAANREPVASVAAPEGQSWSETISQTAEGGYVMGNPDAPIKLIEYGSLTCSHCAEFSGAAMEPLRTEYVDTGRVSFELRNFVRDPIDITGAMLTRCGADESYFALTDQFWANQPQFFEAVQNAGEQAYQSAISAPDDQRYVAMADITGMFDFFAARGISRDQAISCLQNAQTATQLAENTQAQGEQFDITGTPTFLINGRKIEALTWPEVQTALQNAGAR
ncbi:thioredoxin domain-containing protein [uncultured Croceicoccus sp.]|uniref:thioredoxin domain-containing protein n=1 Tax=uncultured Croceicoccus sp. TaxID=1295329 RepID=UPI002620F9BC|nr:thioredoxin domain-containing protein [uncultured Croceicoccus sp.]